MGAVKILFDVQCGVGLGDAVQMSILWRHLKKYRPWWLIDVRATKVMRGAVEPFVNRFWPSESGEVGDGYDVVQALSWADCFHTFLDRPSTKVAYALKFMFGIDEYDPELGRYQVTPEDSVSLPSLPPGAVCVHFSGASRREDKDLPAADVNAVWKFAVENRVFLADINMMTGVRGVGQLASVIRKAAAFVGIDSGPGKVASATDTPTLICWTGHHPLRYHDPAPNTTHLIPEKWCELEPFVSGLGSADHRNHMLAHRFFMDNYRFVTYRRGELAKEACRWVSETLWTANLQIARKRQS